MQEKDLVRKAEGDLRKLLKSVRQPAKIHFCFSNLKTEVMRDKIERAVRRICPKVDFVVNGIDQLLEQIDRNPDAFEKNYEHALADAKRLLERPDRSSYDSDRLGYRVLLATQFDENGIALRKSILRGLVLQVIQQTDIADRAGILQGVAALVGLNRPIEPQYLEETLIHLADEKLILSIDGKRFRLSTNGVEKLLSVGQVAVSKYLDGYEAIRRSLTREVGKIERSDYNKIWQAIKKGLIELFQHYGTQVVELIALIGDKDASRLPRDSPPNVLEGLQRIVRRLDNLDLSLSGDQKLELGERLPYALLDNASGARQWLGHLCLCYVSACSLGLHPDALRRMEVRLKSWHVIPDTHVILSLFGHGEEDHNSIKGIVTWWRSSGGRLIAIDPFIEESVRHAKLAREIIEKWSHTCNRRRHARKWPAMPTSNVFLRSAATLYGDGVGPLKVTEYIDQFFATVGDESLEIRKMLKETYGFQDGPRLQTDSTLDRKLREKIEEVRLSKNYRSEALRENAVIRCRHDASSLAYLSAYRSFLAGSDQVAIILSYSTQLRLVCEQFQQSFGYMAPYIDPGRLVFALSLIPGSTFSTSIVEAALFGTAFQHEVSRHEELAQKVVENLQKSDDVGIHNRALAKRVDKGISEWP